MSDSGRAALHAPFRSRRGRVIGWVAAIGQGVVLLAAAAILPWSGPNTVGWYDRFGFVVVAALIGGGLYRLASVSAVPSETGLVVRNVLLTRNLEWAEILGIHFGTGDSWVLLDLSDGDTLAVMAIQRADGQRATAEASRLATLMALYAHRPSDG
ncbi:MAG TPA: PH domain-containing protein [Kineosporiaceae bacterium]|nr:PH domain-containing protein [Kineosporiaceae bacterium]